MHEKLLALIALEFPVSLRSSLFAEKQNSTKRVNLLGPEVTTIKLLQLLFNSLSLEFYPGWQLEYASWKVR